MIKIKREREREKSEKVSLYFSKMATMTASASNQQQHYYAGYVDGAQMYSTQHQSGQLEQQPQTLEASYQLANYPQHAQVASYTNTNTNSNNNTRIESTETQTSQNHHHHHNNHNHHNHNHQQQQHHLHHQHQVESSYINGSASQQHLNSLSGQTTLNLNSLGLSLSQQAAAAAAANRQQSANSNQNDTASLYSQMNEATKSTKGASKMRRDLINTEIAQLRELLPLPASTRQRLSQLQLMALVLVYVRKSNYFCNGKFNHIYSSCYFLFSSSLVKFFS